MGINAGQLRSLISRVLDSIQLGGTGPVELLMLTAAQESHLGEYLQQRGGPALGIFQMEPSTMRDMWETYLNHFNNLAGKVRHFNAPMGDLLDLEGNIPFQIVLARMKYLRAPGAIPEATAIQALAGYYKTHWNTPLGKATIQEAIDNYRRYC